MFKELKWKYEDAKRKLRETAIVGGVDTGFTWGEVIGATILIAIVVAFALGFVIGPQLTAGDSADAEGGTNGQTGGPKGADDGPDDGGTAEDGGTDGGGTAENGDPDEDGGGGDGDGTDGGPADSDGDPEAGDGDGQGFNRTAFEEAVHGFVNQEREAADREPLTFLPALRGTARTHSDRMVTRGAVAHEIPDGVGFRENYRTADVESCETDGNYTGGQNIAKSFFDTRLSGGERFTEEGALAGHVVDAWMEGNETRRNLLSPGFTLEGIGASYDEETGAVYVTQHLC